MARLARIGVELALQAAFGQPQLDPAVLDGPDHAAVGVDLVHHLDDHFLHAVGVLLQEVAAAQRVDRAADAALEGDHLLRAHRQLRRELGRDLEGLVEGAGEDRLRAAEDGRHRFHRDAHHVVVGLRRDQRRAAAHHAEAEVLRLRILHAVALLHEARPQAAAGAELRDLVEEVHVDVEEEREPLGELLDVAAAPLQFVHVGQAVGQRVGHLFRRRGSRRRARGRRRC